MVAGRGIDGIKLLRASCPQLGLKEAKDICENPVNFAQIQNVHIGQLLCKLEYNRTIDENQATAIRAILGKQPVNFTVDIRGVTHIIPPKKEPVGAAFTPPAEQPTTRVPVTAA